MTHPKDIEQLIASNTSLAAQLADAIDEIERLRAIVNRLPKTADGVPVVTGDHIFVINGPHDISELSVGDWEKRDTTSRPSTSYARSWRCYSTREAAEAAAKERG